MQAVHLETATSTNDRALALVRSGAVSDWAYVLAEAQTQGRGTHGRPWYSPPHGGIYLSVARAIRAAPLPATTAFTLAAGVACAEAIEVMCGLRVRLRPVNDVFVRDRKLGGILTEALVEDGRMLALVVGVGLNLRRFELPPGYGVAIHPTSLEAELPAERFAMVRADALAGALVARLQGAIEAVAEGRADEFRAAYDRYTDERRLSAFLAPS